MRRISLALLVSTVLMSAAPASAAAQALPSDPEADSPSGVVYELPVDRARKDAAPRTETPHRDAQAPSSGGEGGGSSGTAPGDAGAGGGSTETSIRSENNFGTSSEVPGAPADRKQSKRSKKAAGGGDGGDGDGDDADAVDRVAGVAASSTGPTDGPSDGVVFPLLAALLAVGAGIGAVAGRRSLRNRRSD